MLTSVSLARRSLNAPEVSGGVWTARGRPTKALPGGLVLRHVRCEDGEALQTYFRRLSPEARYYRLLGGASELPASELTRALAADGIDTVTLLVASRAGERETIVGEARAAFFHADGEGEFALSIADDWRRTGIGSALLTEIEHLGLQNGVEWLVGDVLHDNAPMIALARRRGFRLELALEARLLRVRKRLHFDD